MHKAARKMNSIHFYSFFRSGVYRSGCAESARITAHLRALVVVFASRFATP
jgi:hypothetical protein